MRKTTTTRELRANLRAMLARAARGEPVTVTLRGKPYVRLVPVEAPVRAATPLRGSVLRMADDFDTPLDELWAALDE